MSVGVPESGCHRFAAVRAEQPCRSRTLHIACTDERIATTLER